MNETNNKYQAALAQYPTRLNDDEVAAQVAAIIEKRVAENNTPEVKKFLFNCIDLTTLRSEDSDESVMKFVQKVNLFDEQHPDLKNVAAICVYPNFAEIVKDTLEVEDVKIACVSGGFPSSQTFIEVKVAETAMAIMEGADEIDIVISVGKFLAGDYEQVCDEIEELKATCKEHHLKVILETGALQSAANIKKASVLAMYSGADFIKTSTGKQQPAATPEAAYVMCNAIKEYYEKTGRKVGFKPCRRHQLCKRCSDLLLYRERSIGRGMAQQLSLPLGHKPFGQPLAERDFGRRNEVFLNDSRIFPHPTTRLVGQLWHRRSFAGRTVDGCKQPPD